MSEWSGIEGRGEARRVGEGGRGGRARMKAYFWLPWPIEVSVGSGSIGNTVQE